MKKLKEVAFPTPATIFGVAYATAEAVGANGTRWPIFRQQPDWIDEVRRIRPPGREREIAYVFASIVTASMEELGRDQHRGYLFTPEHWRGNSLSGYVQCAPRHPVFHADARCSARLADLEIWRYRGDHGVVDLYPGDYETDAVLGIDRFEELQRGNIEIVSCKNSAGLAHRLGAPRTIREHLYGCFASAIESGLDSDALRFMGFTRASCC
ncbi:MAG: hypothetical protein JWR07_5105 [Nevskia sp.]|nr:hypothetical protein [Nevskia sp.]